MEHYHGDVCVIGAGVIGSAVANELTGLGLSVFVIDVNPRPGMEITSRNSEIIHAGLYYPQNSLKAKLCVEGRRLLYDFAARHGVNHRQVGKYVVATTPEEASELEGIYNQAEANGVLGVRVVDEFELKKIEPEVAAVRALYVPESGIISAHDLCNALCRLAKEKGCEFAFKTAVIGLAFENNRWSVLTDTVVEDRDKNINTPNSGAACKTRGNPFTISVKSVINCAGLFSDRIAELAGIDIYSAGYQLHWVKGEYFSLPSSWSKRVSHLIYPLPEKNVRGVGVHLTVDLGGQVKLGPNVVEVGTEADYTVDPSHAEVFFNAASKYLPGLKLEELSPYMAGIRPKLSKPGEPARDFIIAEESSRELPGLVNLIGIESPGLTSSLAIAKVVGEFF